MNHYLLLLLLFFTFWPHCTACGLLTPWPGIEPRLPALEAPSINHGSPREAPIYHFKQYNYSKLLQYLFSVSGKKNYLFYMTPSPNLLDFFLFKISILYWGTTLLTNVCIVKAMVFPALVYGCESCTMKKAERLRIDAFELWCWRRLESPLDCKIKLVHPKGNQSWIFPGRTDAEAEAPILWPPDKKNWLTGKDSDAGKIEGGRRRGQQRMRWLDGINGHEFEQTPGESEGQGA